MKPLLAVLLAAAGFAGLPAAAGECGFSARDAVFSNDRAEDAALLAALGETVAQAGHLCPKVLAAARCRTGEGIAFDVFCADNDFVVRTGKDAAPPFAKTTVRRAK